MTTTAVTLHPENETRLLSVTVTDTPEQTKSVLRVLAAENASDPDLSSWLELQVWLEGAEHRATIPYRQELVELIPSSAVRLRRDIRAVLNLIQSHAILHQVSRSRDERGAVIATLDDYGAVWELVADLVAEGVEVVVSRATRETVSAVGQLQRSGKYQDGIPQRPVAELLGLDKGAASRRIRTALDRGYLKNLEDRRGRPARLQLGDPLPDDIPVLPSPQDLEAAWKSCSVDPDSDGNATPHPSEDEEEICEWVA